MKSVRGIGNVYQPTYRDKRTGELKRAAAWWIVFSIHGRRIAENAHSTNRADATRLLKKRVGDAAIGRPAGPELDRTNLDDLLAMVEADYKANGKRSLDRVLQAAMHLRDFFHSDRKARDITSDRITAFAARRLEQGAQPATVNYEMAVLRRAFRLAVRAGKAGIRPEFPMLEVNNTRKGFFEPEQYRAVVNHLPEYLKPVARTLYTTGWRISELLSRQWRHLDFATGWLRLEPGESKNREGREFPFTPDLRALLEARREHVREIERATGRIIPGCSSIPTAHRSVIFATPGRRHAGRPAYRGDSCTTSAAPPSATSNARAFRAPPR